MESLPLDEFMRSGPTEITWAVEGIFPTEGVGILAGKQGVGKKLDTS